LVGESPLTKKRRKRKRQGIALVLFSLVAFSVLAWQYIGAQISDEGIDSQLCPSESGPGAFWAVVIDGTDSYNTIQWEDIRNHFEQIKSRVPRHGMLAVFTVSENPSEVLNPEFALCNPGSGENLSVLTDNPARAKRRWENDFEAPLDSIFDALDREGTLRRSPIMETITAVKVVSDRYTAGKRRMFIISDMMQHTERYSHYRGEMPSVRNLKSQPFYQNLMTDLSGWKVTIYYAWREGDPLVNKVQGRRHLEFWSEYLNQVANLKADSAFEAVPITG